MTSPYDTTEHLHKLWGRPPGLRPTPPSACWRLHDADIVVPAAGRGRPAQTRGSAPQTRQHSRYWENYVALGCIARPTNKLRRQSGKRGGAAMGQDFGAQGGLVSHDQTLHGDVVLEVRLHDLRHVGRFHTGIPDAFGVDDHVGAVGAQAERTTNRDLDFIFESMSGDFAAQRVDDLG